MVLWTTGRFERSGVGGEPRFFHEVFGKYTYWDGTVLNFGFLCYPHYLNCQVFGHLYFIRGGDMGVLRFVPFGVFGRRKMKDGRRVGTEWVHLGLDPFVLDSVSSGDLSIQYRLHRFTWPIVYWK